MIPLQYKFLAALLAIGAILSGAFLFGVDYQKGKQAKKEVKIIIKEVINSNEDSISQQKHTNDIAKIQKSHEKELRELRLVVGGDICAIGDIERLWNEAAIVANSYVVEN
jgi:hypothetical protein